MSQTYASAVEVVQSIDSVPHILKLLSEATDIGFVCIAHVTSSSWTACAVYDQINFKLQPGEQLNVTSTLCDKVRSEAREVVIEAASQDSIYKENSVCKQYGFESYFSYPLYDADNNFFGTLCGLDVKPAMLKTEKLAGIITSFASLISRQIASGTLQVATQLELKQEREAVRLREQNIAILGHDLRTPLSSITMGLDALEQHSSDPQTVKIVSLMRASSMRIKRLVNDVMDFAHTRVSQGVIVDIAKTSLLAEKLTHTVEELANANFASTIDVQISIQRDLYCDAERICQLLSNLLINALVHGDVSHKVLVRAYQANQAFVILVENRGETIPANVLHEIFEPFRKEQSNNEGLGLGLFIASEIAKAHNGTLNANSEHGCTRFTFSMPI